MDHGGNPYGLDYVFSHFTGILLTSTFFMVVYCIIKRNRPVLYPQVILPALASGCLWAVAQCSWFIANQDLSMVVSFPIIATGPGVVASLWGVLLFREIQGVRNILLLVAAYLLTGTGVTLITLSKLTK